MVRKEREPTIYRPNQGDIVICTSGGVPYDAKVLQVGKDPKDTSKNPETKYFVHYAGWNKNWDEWVPLDRIQERTEENVKNMKEAKARAKTKGPGSNRKKLAVQQSRLNSSSVSQSQESINELSITEPEKSVVLEKEVKIKIPDELRTWLIDDENNIKNNKKLTILPAKPTVTMILKDFINHKKNTSRSANETVLGELTLGIKDYFNVMLGSHLLYKFERLQYQHLLKEHGKDVDLASQYGVIHLARLFTQIGRILAHSTLETSNIQTIVGYMQELLKFISKQTNLFDIEKNYNVAPPDYIKNALK